ncbi:MAG: DNA internalization-related competence protein ComEC/Rec2 [Tissierellia bacterium]|nr:DNA internalization-related competence protein ComEC/Rec2 [Tissierellia bacterium]
MRRPFVFFTIPLLLGIVFYYFIEISIYTILFLIMLTIVSSLIRLRLNLSIRVHIIILFFLVGVLTSNIKAKGSQLLKYVDLPIEARGIVKNIKTVSQDEGRYVVSIDKIEYDGKEKKVSENILLKIIGDKDLSLGDEIIFSGVLREPLPNTNPKLFNYKLNLLTDSIYTTATIRDYSIIYIRSTPNLLYRLKGSFIDRVEKIFDIYLVEENSRLMKSILFGNYSYLEEESLEQFRDLGLAHVLAVSGLHIGIISGLLIGIFTFIGINRRANIILTIIILWIYAYIIGWPPSVLRANIMFTILLFSQLLAEPYDSINTLFFALFILAIINPFWIFNVGFQLSFIATFFILYISPKLSLFTYSKDSKIVRSAIGILSVQIGLLPVLVYYFNRIPLIAIVANILLLPLFTISLILSIILIPISFVSHTIADSIGILIDFLLSIELKGLEVLSHFPMLNIRLPSPSIVEIFLYYILLFIIFNIKDIRYIEKGLIKSIVFYLLVLILINSLATNLDKSITINFIDVGQGDSILIRTQGGNYLIDTGGELFGDFDIGKNILLPYLEKEGIFRLKGVFITHFDADHCKALPYIMDNLKIDNIFIGYERDDNSLYKAIKEKAIEKDVPIRILKKGDNLKLDANTGIYVIGPGNELLRNPKISHNDLSLVLLLDYYNRYILFTGDIERLGEESVLNSLNVEIDFIKVPHHGSNTSSGLDLLNRLKPKIGFISVGRNNSFGHPHKEVIDRYEAKNIILYRTDELGLITLMMDGTNYQIIPFIKEKLSIIYVLKHYGIILIYLMGYIMVSYILVKIYSRREYGNIRGRDDIFFIDLI